MILLALIIPFKVYAETELPPLHHVVNVDVPESMTIPESFKLNQKGQIDCDTCHGIKDIADIPFDEVDKGDPDFFNEGPYPVLTEFCYQCHDEKDYKRNNIHVLLDDHGEIKEEECKFCHQTLPERDRAYTLDELEFRLPPQKLCIGCHLKTPHLNAINHLLEVDDDMLQHIRESEKEYQVVLPLDGNKILCISCHSSHQKGVIKSTEAASNQVQDRDLQQGIGYQQHAWNDVVKRDKQERLDELNKEIDRQFKISYQRIEYEVLLRLPAKDGTLCLACHQFDL